MLRTCLRLPFILRRPVLGGREAWVPESVALRLEGPRKMLIPTPPARKGTAKICRPSEASQCFHATLYCGTLST
eukprot:856595-Prorocentrum_minimum.AAC.1